MPEPSCSVPSRSTPPESWAGRIGETVVAGRNPSDYGDTGSCARQCPRDREADAARTTVINAVAFFRFIPSPSPDHAPKLTCQPNPGATSAGRRESNHPRRLSDHPDVDLVIPEMTGAPGRMTTASAMTTARSAVLIGSCSRTIGSFLP